jgi:hypothetical protein
MGRQASCQKHSLKPQIVLCSVQHAIISWLPFIVCSLKTATDSESFLTICALESCWTDSGIRQIKQPAHDFNDCNSEMWSHFRVAT